MNVSGTSMIVLQHYVLMPYIHLNIVKICITIMLSRGSEWSTLFFLHYKISFIGKGPFIYDVSHFGGRGANRFADI